MEKFLDALRGQLQDQLTGEQIEFQLSLYRRYMKEEAEKGKSEEQILQKLGDPKLVSEMIVNSYRKREKEKKEVRSVDEINASIQNPEHGIHAEFKENEGWDVRIGNFKLNSWYGTFTILGIVLVIFIVLSSVFP